MIGEGEKAGLSRPALGKIILESKLRYRGTKHVVISEKKLPIIFEFEQFQHKIMT